METKKLPTWWIKNTIDFKALTLISDQAKVKVASFSSYGVRMYVILGAAATTYLASQKAGETGGHWIINQNKEVGFFNDYRSVGALGAGVVAGMTHGNAQAAAVAVGLGLGLSYLADAGQEKSRTAGAPMQPPVGTRVIGTTPQGQPIYGAAQPGSWGADMANAAMNQAYQEALQYGYSPDQAAAYAQQMGAAYGCAPVYTLHRSPGPYAGRGVPPWAYDAMQGAPIMAPPF